MPNRLAGESSPYLLQHADNPVDWMPWSDEALALARERQRPILLSIGYSACHWCHVMAHESFEDETTAALMNRHFVNIKVDREERPDLDRIYQTAHQLLTGRPGGWPLTMFLLPDSQLPFFGGTYFPDRPRHGMISFAQLLERIAELYAESPRRIHDQGESVRQALLDIEIRERSNRGGTDIGLLEIFDRQFLDAHDDRHGGLGQAPKFPQPAMLGRALRRSADLPSTHPLRRAIVFSLRQIASGGIRDHVGGGFFRYSVDDRWMIPHFEKMLYDNGQLLELFAEAYAVTGDASFRETVGGLVDWLRREMRAPCGAFYAALDADSEGREGLYYLWTPDEVHELVEPEFYPAFARRYGLDREANFEGAWHLHGYEDPASVAAALGIDPAACERAFEASRQALLARRRQRVAPRRDDKLLTAWNALAIRGLARAAAVFARPDYHVLARDCLDALRAQCWRDGRLLALSAASGKRQPAYLDDYAQLLHAILACLQHEWRGEDFEWALTLADQLVESFADARDGGFYFTAADHEQLIIRPRSWQDEAMPNGNAAAALALYRLGLLVGDTRLTETAERALQSVADNLARTPLHAAGFCQLLAETDSPPMQIVVRGERRALEAWRERLLPKLRAGQAAFLIPSNQAGLPGLLAEKTAAEAATAWVCEGFSCRAPIAELEMLLALVDQQNQSPDRDQ